LQCHEQADASRATFLRRGFYVASGLAVAGGVATALPALVGAASDKKTEQVLNLVLMIEYAESALYADALKAGKLDGELKGYAQTVAGHERQHLALIKKALGGAAAPAPKHDFGAATQSSEAFAKTAAELEDLAVAAYNGQAANLAPEAFVAAARIVSVEARHAAWVRSIVGRDPAPQATDKPKNEAQVRAGLKKLGVHL
jgi:ferritin-like protein